MHNRILLILFGFLSSCSESEVSIPGDVLDKNKMTEILSDIHIAQAAITNRAKKDSVDFSMNDYVQYILSEHKIKSQDFLNSLKFYSDNPEVLSQIYDSVITGLSRNQGEIEADDARIEK